MTEIAFDLRDRYHSFLKGHRIMVQIQSTWFPLIDRMLARDTGRPGTLTVSLANDRNPPAV